MTNDKDRWNGRKLKKAVGDWRRQKLDPKEQASVRLPEGKTEEREVTEPVPAASEPKKEVEPPVKHLRLTDRDRQLMGILATVRYLSLAQLARLLFAGRSPINLHKRLLALAGEGRHGVKQPYLRQLKFRTWEGMPQTAWTLTPLGYAVAASVLPSPPRRPTSDAGASFIEHGLLLNELYVQLLEVPVKRALAEARARAGATPAFEKTKAGIYGRAAHPAFRWKTHDDVRLPWKDYEMKRGKKVDRLIVPDATLELPGAFSVRVDREVRQFAGRRVFLEAETGSQSIVATSENKPGATLNKLSRYCAFLRDEAGTRVGDLRPTWYESQFPDGFDPTVLFLVANEGRAASVNRAIEGHYERTRRIHDRRWAFAMTAPAAAAVYGAALGAPTASPIVPSRNVTSAELQLLNRICTASLAALKLARAEARVRGIVPPSYPDEHADYLNLQARLASRGVTG